MDWLFPLFLKTMNMAVSASWLIAVLLLLRPLLKRIAPKWLVCALWVLVAVRLVFPASLLHSDLSVYRLAGGAVQESGQVTYFSGTLDTGDRVVGYTPATLLPGADLQPSQAGDALAPLTAARDYTQGGIPLLWMMGVLLLLAVALAGYVLIRSDVAASVPLGGRVYVCDEIATPFILGVLHPRIYLTSGLDGAARQYVLLHEEAHLRRGDHIWKPLGYLLLAVYWYDPLVWVAYICFCRDMELACDERVIRTMAASERADYSQTLLNCACGRRWVTACPLAFGEVGVKARVKAVLRHKKPAVWAVPAAVVLCAALAIGFLTDPKAAEREKLLTTTVTTLRPDGSQVVTEDTVFLLSDSKVGELFATEADAAASPTAYARQKDEVQGEDTNTYASDAFRPAVSWWLRSTDGGNHPDAVQNIGWVGEGSRSYEPDYIRPAVWITLANKK